jgi:hypothetical protein
MSIKQNGGVFGRNPTFNDVTIEGQLTFDGDIDINSDLTVDGNLDVTGQVAIGTGSPATTLTVAGSYANGLELDRNGADATSSARLFFDSSSGATAIYNYQGNTLFTTGATAGSASGAEKLRIKSTGDVSVSNGNLVIGTSGKGIDFSATAGTGTSELLDDYEEGVWSGGLNLYGGVGTVTEERYTKIGNLVVASCNVGLDGTADGSGFIINGLPFTPLGSSSDAYGCTINYNTGNEPTAKGLIFGGTTGIKIVTNTKSEINYTTFQNGSACELSLTAIYYA